MFLGSDCLCEDCRKKLRRIPEKRQKKWNRTREKPVYYVYVQSQECERLLMRLFRSGDLDAGRIFLAAASDQKKILRRYPVRFLGFSPAMPQVQAVFSAIRLKEAGRPGQKKRGEGYLAVSLVPVSPAEMEAVLADPLCRGLWILLQKPENLPEEIEEKKSFPHCLFTGSLKQLKTRLNR